ncbi:hypothetical protein HF670_12055 [Acidithiobacillus thiooxidans]|uniref:hypothetical protein n=1 Tax=Acidithiobacillus thiooxidans TaxID=930 RepID=UPI001C06F739|nr:hypothetical protein [Acidithiobacillus thiooxidans]MBU2840280.1 hypothetical protein [Acidithiobacillus thiooxidans]
MAEFVRITHKETLLRLFQALDQRIKKREGQSTVKGFWQSGSMNSLFLPDTSPEAMSVRYMGFWKATASMAQGKVEILSAVLEGNVRIGTLSSCLGSAIPFFGEKFISADVAESLGLTVIDCFEMQTESGVQCVTLVKAENGELSEATLNKLLAGE